MIFYSSYFFAALVISCCCVYFYLLYGMEAFAFLFWFKVATLWLFYYFINIYKKKEFYYYQNLGISKKVLWSTTLTLDFVLFILLLIVGHKIR